MICRLVVTVLAVGYALALAAVAGVALGVIGEEAMAPAMSALRLLGLPSTLLYEGAEQPRWIAFGAPALNIAVLAAVCRALGALRRRTRGVGAHTRPAAFLQVRLVYGATVALGVLSAGLLGWWLVDPAPPSTITIATGPEGGFYETLGRRFRVALTGHGLHAELEGTAGTAENLERLQSGSVDVAFVQGGVGAPPDGHSGLKALATLAVEPLWLFTRGRRSLSDLLEEPRLAIAGGAKGSGTRALMQRLLHLTGLSERVDLVPLSGMAAADALLAGEVDVAAFVTAPDTPWVDRLLRDGRAGLVEMTNLDAITRRMPFMEAIELPQRVIDFGANVPPRDVVIAGAATGLVVREELHPAIKQLLLQTATEVVRGQRLLGTFGEFPSPGHNEYPLDAEAERFFTYGPTLLRRYLPFWAANLAERFWVLIIPIATLVLPIVRFGPTTVAWGIRRRIYRHYRDLKELEAAAARATTQDERRSALRSLERIDEQLRQVSVPLPYRDDLYRLRTHVAFVRSQLEPPSPSNEMGRGEAQSGAVPPPEREPREGQSTPYVS